MTERQSSEITIYRLVSGSATAIVTVPITPESTRVFSLMSEDSITLSFNLLTPVDIQIGDYINDELFGKFYILDKQAPVFNEANGCYKYNLRFDAYYYLWKNKLFKLTALINGVRKRKEVSWTLTGNLASHAQEIVNNLSVLGIKYGTQAFTYSILESATHASEAKCISYDGTDIISGIAEIARVFECEWWVAGNTIYFGKCEHGDELVLSLEERTSGSSTIPANLFSITPQRNESNYANRIYFFGSTQNVPETYNKHLIFQVTNTYTKDGVSLFRDSNRKITKDMLAQGTINFESGFTATEFTGTVDTGSDYDGHRQPCTKETIQSDNIVIAKEGRYSFRLNPCEASFVLFWYHPDGAPMIELMGKYYFKAILVGPNSFSEELFNTEGVATKMPSSILATETATTVKVAIPETTINYILSAGTYYIKIEVTRDATDFNFEVYLDEGELTKKGLIALTCYSTYAECPLFFNSTEYKVRFNPLMAEQSAEGFTKFAFVNNGTITAAPTGFGVGSEYTLGESNGTTEGLEITKVPISFWTDNYSDPNSLLKIGENRLHLPLSVAPNGYLDGAGAENNDDIIEKSVILEDIFPKCTLRVSQIETKQRKNTEEHSDGSDTFWNWTQFILHATLPNGNAFPFRESFIKAGVTLQARFITPDEADDTTPTSAYKLAGMTFDILLGKDSSGNPTYTLKRNEDFGALLPNDSLCPEVGDSFILLGWDVRAISSLGLVAQAEQKLADVAEDYMDALAEDQLTFITRMFSDSAYSLTSLPTAGQKVRVKYGTIDRGTRILGYTVNLAQPFNTPEFTCGETEVYSRLKQIEKKLTQGGGSASGSITDSSNGAGGSSSSGGSQDLTNYITYDEANETYVRKDEMPDLDGYIKKEGTSSQFVKGDGSLDNNVYALKSEIGESYFDKVNIGTEQNPKYAIKVKEAFEGLFTLGFLTAGGIGSDGGGGESLTDMWLSLKTNNAGDDFYNEKVHAGHLPLGTGFSIDDDGKINVVATGSVSSVAGVSPVGGNVPTAGLMTALGISNLNNDLATISGCLTSLQAQIDSVASRDMYDELTVSALFADIASMSTLYAEAVVLNGSDLATTLGTFVPKITTVNGHALSGNITISKADVGLGNVENTALSAWAGTGNITTLGTITTGVWHGTPIANDYLTNKTIGVGNATITLGGSATLTQIGIPGWAQKASLAFSDMPAMYIARTRVISSAANDTLLGITAISNAASTNGNDESRIEWDATNHAWHFYGGIYADTFVVAGGVGSSGGGSDIDLDRVWESLTNNTDFPDVKINLAHIPGIPWANILSKPTTIAGYGIADAYTKTQVDSLIGAINQFHYEIAASTSAVTDPQSNVLYLIGPTGSGPDKYEEYVYANNTWTKIGDTSIDLTPYLTITVAAQTYQPIISDLATIRSNAEKGSTAYSDLTTVSAILQSLQSQVDSVASRDTFDEITATVFYSDVAVVSDLYVGAVSLGGVDLAGSLSSLSSRATNLESRATALEGRATSLEGRATTLEGYFTNGVANSALRLSGTAAYNIWGVEYWSSGVPKSVTGRPGLYIGTTQVQTSAASQDLNGIADINASGLATIAGGIKLTTTKRIYFGDTDHYLELDSNGFHFSHGVYSEDFVTAGGIGSSGSGGGGIVDAIHRYADLGGTFSDSDNDVFNAYTVNKINTDLSARISQLEGGSATSITTTGSGNVVTGVSKAGTVITVTKGTTLGSLATLSSITTSYVTDLESWIAGKGYVTSSGVTSVGLSVPTGLSVSGSPVTGSGTLAITFASGYSIPTTAQQSAWSGKQDAISDLTTIRNNAANGATAYGWGNHASAGYLTSANGTTISDCLKSLQSQIDSVASRDMFDELSATVLHSDIVTASNAYFEAITGSLSGNATTASYLVGSAYGVGSGLNPIYFSGGRPVASTATAGSAAVPVFLNGGTLTAITPSSLFSALSSSAATNLSMTIAGQGRTIADLYARYDKDGGEIAPNMTTIGTALRSLQSQVDSVASRDRFDELNATVLFTDVLSVGGDTHVGGKIWFDSTHYIEFINGYLHTNLPIVSDSYITAGA